MDIIEKIDKYLNELKKKGRPPKYNQKGYEFYVVVNNKIQSGWEYREDAQDMEDELKENGKKAKIYKKQGLKKLDLDPDNNKD
ncbi:MAG: hypothetical protein ACOC1K_08300 [Nanoarchaeota archaeon]